MTISHNAQKTQRIAELETQLKTALGVIDKIDDTYEEKIAALLVAIEAKGAAIDSLVSWVDDWAETSDTDFPRLEAQVNAARVLSPSAELLEARDRNRDAKLLRHLKLHLYDATFHHRIAKCIDLKELASKRESGEWQPEL